MRIATTLLLILLLLFPEISSAAQAASRPGGRSSARAAERGKTEKKAASTGVPGEELPGFSLHKLESGTGPTLLVIGGIQGDEPGGFSAASLLVTHYKIEKGNVWVVPNLNFPSIIYRQRGVHGDMNRKFAALNPNDPEYETVRRIQNIILDEQVDIVINMHDGSGFYRPRRQDALYNPDRWGQSVIIDQEKLEGSPYGNLKQLALNVSGRVNRRLLAPPHAYYIKNTDTKGRDREMEKSLSYFAVCNNKSAFGIEASKELPEAERVYYHINLLEAFMHELGIKFRRDFTLSPQGVVAALNRGVRLNLYDNLLVLPLDNARASLPGVIPVSREAALNPSPSNPLLALVRAPQAWRVVYGNRTLIRLKPEYMDFDFSLGPISLLVDGKDHAARPGDTVPVERNFLVRGLSGYRVNVIGAQRGKHDGSECEVLFSRDDFMPQYSLDRDGNIFRVEVYKGEAFAGMLLVNFGRDHASAESGTPLTATVGKENDLGR